MTLEARFWAKVRKGPGCWTWTGAHTAPGWHGVFAVDASRRGRTMVVAHRVSWELANGPIPDGLVVCHACDNPACVRPDHLWLGTQRANMIDASRKGRMVREPSATCKRGHPWTPETVMRSSTGRRKCRVCARARRVEYDALRRKSLSDSLSGRS